MKENGLSEMKKFAFLGFALMAALPTWADASSSSAGSQGESCGFRSGFRAGVGLGYKVHRVENKYQYTITNPGFAAFSKGEARQVGSTRKPVFYQIHAAYDWVRKPWVLSIEVDYRYDPGVNKSRITSSEFFLRRSLGDFLFEQSHLHDFGLGIRAGRTLTSQFSIYGIVNLRLGQFNYKFMSEKRNLNAAFRLLSGQNKQFRWGGGLGVGCQYALGKGFFVGPEIIYDIYQAVKIKQNLTVDPTTAVLSVYSSRPKIFNAIVKISKIF